MRRGGIRYFPPPVTRIATLLLCLAAACGSVRVVDRAGDGRAILIRGGQPTRSSLQRLQETYGIKTVVNLRGENPEKAWFLEERRAVEEIEARWVHIRLSGREAPSQESVEAFFRLVEEPANWPIFLHCESGVHRTGVMTALYRMQFQGWPPDEALAEMERRGFGWGMADRSVLRSYILSFNPDRNRELPAAASGDDRGP
jgi:protein tyrosine phosphatase (PTP) superfamily phosphohydrolase (DUF442 family)